MEFLGDPGIGFSNLVFLLIALFIAMGFEFVNGFHDTANAVATVIYTNTMKPWPAVMWSGFCNFLGVYLGGIAVAYSIVHLLPVELLLQTNTREGMAMVLALLLAAISWNLGTWYLGIPCSSSHTLIGAILGVGLANGILHGRPFGTGVNWEKTRDVGLSLLFSPLFGFFVAAGLLLLVIKLFPNPILHTPPINGKPPPWPMRLILFGTCSGVSFAHGSNDGQKGMGLIMLILIGSATSLFAVNLESKPADLDSFRNSANSMDQILTRFDPPSSKVLLVSQLTATRETLVGISSMLEGRTSFREIVAEDRKLFREKVITANHAVKHLVESLELDFTPEEIKTLSKNRKTLAKSTEYVPWWVILMVALALGIGTTVGWKRIVVTVGEKIGKSHLTFAQGATAEMITAGTISMAVLWGAPVSTTHILSSGVAGTMAASKAGLQLNTVRTIALAWVLTLPVSMIKGGAFFAFLRAIL
ncbi:MAG: inorganic phosphate transporter [Gemmataceae bacterium]|nr:inorganic phosphate transporter [Gemmataceae bacterium]